MSIHAPTPWYGASRVGAAEPGRGIARTTAQARASPRAPLRVRWPGSRTTARKDTGFGSRCKLRPDRAGCRAGAQPTGGSRTQSAGALSGRSPLKEGAQDAIGEPGPDLADPDQLTVTIRAEQERAERGPARPGPRRPPQD